MGPRTWSPRKAAIYLSCALVTIALGLASRHYGAYLPAFLAAYTGDTLWALLVFLAISVLAPDARLSRRGGAAITIAFLVEISQLYHAPWIDTLRATRIGGLVLGFGFLWTDLACYTAGISAGALADRAIRNPAWRGKP